MTVNYKTSGASEAILAKPASLTSRGDGAKDTSTDRGFAGDRVNNDTGIVVETNVGAVGTPSLFVGSNDDSFDDLLVFDSAVWFRVDDGGGDDVANVTKPSSATTVNQNHPQGFGAGVIG